MMTNENLKIIRELLAGATREEIIWLNGYTAGLITQTGKETYIQTAGKPQVKKITIAYGTESGNSKKLAADFAAKAKKNGIHAKMVSLDQYRLDDLHKEEYFFTVISTQGEGEPPAAAKKFYDHIHKNGFRLQQLKYGVLALGDTAYPLFCKAGEDLDSQFQKLGGERIVSLQKCDTDYHEDAGKWFSEILEKLIGPDDQSITTSQPQGQPQAIPVIKNSGGGGKKIYQGRVLANINLNDHGSNKKTFHIEIAAADLDYQPGDSVGIIPENRSEMVEAIIALTRINPHKLLRHKEQECTVLDLLQKKLNIIHLPQRTVQKYAGLVQQEIPETRISLLDLLKIYPVNNSAQFEEVISVLEPIPPRLYSVSSSLQSSDGEVHITVALDNFTVNDETKYGLCSDYLSRIPVNSPITFYIHKNARFKLPAPDKDIIMIGPGTGIAPFRAFLTERDSTGAQGKNWLFFGDQHFATDFLYQTEIQQWKQAGVLTKIHLAFSRDKKQKVYVQHKMLEHGEEFFSWLNAGAHVYVCGTKIPMSVAVENSVLQIIKKFGQKNDEQAIDFLDELKIAERYVTDVY